MLVLSLFMTLFIFVMYSNTFQFILFSFFILLYFIFNTNMFFNSMVYFNNSFSFYDELGLFMCLLLFFVMFISYIYALSFKSLKNLNIVMVSLLFFCYQVFTTNHLLFLYFFYEASLIPILYIIIKWGSYPERSISAMMLLTYTVLFSAPFILVIIYLFIHLNTWYLDLINNYTFSSSFLFSFIIFISFAVKLPIYGVHYWLPMAHVEAPTFGSVILASILLKLGGVGLIRLVNIMNIGVLNNYLLSYFLIFTIFSTMICCFQSDMKRLIAYSSVAHMMVIPFMIFSYNILSIQTITMVMLYHGLSSSLLFMSVGILYSMYSSRQLVLMRGLVLVSPLFSFFLILTFFFTLSAPPFPSFIAEVYFMFSTYFLTSKLIYTYILFVFLGLVYNLNWLTSVLFSSSTNMVYTESLLKYNLFMPIFLIFIKTIFLMLLFSCF